MNLIVCTKCDDKFDDCDVRVNGIVCAEKSPDGKSHVDLIFTCPSCEAEYFAFVAVKDILPCDEEG